ncbi:MAG: NUDIX domain-containing protein [Nanoarchaeota archaeon]|nr:NUDIX domain-containing protein [Nanoarchaeota archaeon]MBU1269081.1 NUDIX domain-containing protein [Nanoarchaeota archaeon]MBU1604734.1 NUDIX domain-containing protein [Nanoarchaeota archaeon]MBU2442986.1 NUDIX domain-containing protein [Nanoarchaeota archaeon]
MEFLDVVDESDNVVGNASKVDIYKKSLRHRIVHILIFNNKGEMALQLRSAKVSYCPLHWSTAVGGHVSSGESYEQAGMREYKEELGTTSKLEFFSKDPYVGEGTPNKFLATFKTTFNGPFHPDLNDVEEVSFFTIEQIKKMIRRGEKFHPELLFLLKKHFF